MSSNSSIAHPVGIHPAAPIPAVGTRYSLLASSGSSGIGSASLNASTLPAASGSWLRTEVMNVVGWDTCALEIAYNGHVSSSTGYPLIIPMGSNAVLNTDATQVAPPLLTDDVWFMLPTIDGTVTQTALSGTLGIGSGSMGSVLAGYQKVFGQVIQGPAVVTGSQKVRQMVSLKVRPCRWLCFAVAERGDNTNPGTVNLWTTGII